MRNESHQLHWCYAFVFSSFQDQRDLIKAAAAEDGGGVSDFPGMPPLAPGKTEEFTRSLLATLGQASGGGVSNMVALEALHRFGNPGSAALLAAAGIRTPPSNLFPPNAPHPQGGMSFPGSRTPPPMGHPGSNLHHGGGSSPPGTPGSHTSASPVGGQNFSSQQNWSFEEQFKQVSESTQF